MNLTSLEELLKLGFLNEVAEMYTAIPCKITNIPSNLTDLRVDVQPVINTSYSDGTSEEHTQILGVPVVFPSGRTSMLSFPLFVGDIVLCVFSQRSLDNFKIGFGENAQANDLRQFDSRDAIAIPGLTPFGKSLNRQLVRKWPHSTSDFVVAHNIATGTEVELRMHPNGNLVINTSQNVSVNCANAAVTCANATVTASNDITMTAENNIALSAATMSVNVGTTSWNGAILQNGDYTQAGVYTLAGINMNIHMHTGVTPGTGTSAGPIS